MNSERLNDFVSDGEIADAASLRSFALIPSGPEALLVSRLKSVSRTSLSVMVIDSRVDSR